MSRGIAIVLVLAACHHHARVAPPPRAPAPPPVVVVPRPRALGPEVALSTIRASYLGGVRACYRRALVRDDATRGRLTVLFTVDPAGRLSARRARAETARASAVEACVERAMATWVFPPARRETTLRLTFDLRT